MEYVWWTNQTSKIRVFKNWFTQIWPKTNSIGIIVSEGLMRLYNDSPSFLPPRSIHQGGSNSGITWRPLPEAWGYLEAKLCGWLMNSKVCHVDFFWNTHGGRLNRHFRSGWLQCRLTSVKRRRDSRGAEKRSQYSLWALSPAQAKRSE